MKFLRIFYILILFLIFSKAYSDINSQESINKIRNLNDQIYSFSVFGHIYGSPSASVFPSASILSGTEKIKDYRPNFLVLLGDTIQHGNSASNIFNIDNNRVQKFNDAQFETFEELFLNKINIPVLHVPGNHDYPDEEWYKYNFGYNSNINFEIQSEAFILFNSMNLCSKEIEPNLEEKFILENLEIYKNNPNIKNIFLLMHQAIFTSEDSELKDIRSWVNGGVSSCPSYNNKVLPLLNEVQEKKNIFLIAGDTGCKGYTVGASPTDTFPLFYHEKQNIKYLVTGICENINDNFVNIIINEGVVDFEPVSLVYDKISNIETFNLAFWKQHFSSWDQKQLKFEQDYKFEVFKKAKPLKKIEKIIKLITDIFKSKKFYAGIIFSFIIIFFIRRFSLIFSK